MISAAPKWRRDGRMLAILVLVPWLCLMVYPLGLEIAGYALLATLLLITCLLPTTWRSPAFSWVWLLLLPAALFAWVMALPLGYGHHFTQEDRQVLGVAPAAYAINADRAAIAAVWGLFTVAFGIAASAVFRGSRAWMILRLLVLFAAVHAAGALVLSVFIPDWPSDVFVGRVRGLYSYPNHAASTWASLVPAALVLAKMSKRPGRWWLAAVILLLGVVLSASRGAILVAALATTPWWWQALPKRRRVFWLGLVIAAFVVLLSVLNVDTVRNRFGQWHTAEEFLEGNGRAMMWENALPSIAEAGPLGVGPGGTEMAWRRHGPGGIGNNALVDLHQDPLQWILERGWVGALLLFIGMVAVALIWYPRIRALPKDRQLLCAASLGGLAVFVLHGCIDFIWQSPAVALQGLIFLALISGALARQHGAQPTWRHRLVMMCFAGGLFASLWWVQPIVREFQVLDQTVKLIQRTKVGDPKLKLPFIDRVLAIDAQTAELAHTQAAILIARARGAAGDDGFIRADNPLMLKAKALLETSAKRAPGSAHAWIRRVSLASHGVLGSEALGHGLGRLEEWAPNWRHTQYARIEALVSAKGGFSHEDTIGLIEGVLQSDVKMPAYFPYLTEQFLGEDEAIRLYRNASVNIIRSAINWASSRSSVDNWLLFYQKANPEIWQLPLSAWGIRGELPVVTKTEWSKRLDQRVRQAHVLIRARLELPPGLDVDPSSDELLRAVAMSPVKIFNDVELRQRLKSMAGERQHTSLGKLLWRRLELIEMISRGLLPERVPSPDMSDILAAVRTLDDRPDITQDLRDTVDLILARHRHPKWLNLPGSGKFSQVEVSAQNQDYHMAVDSWTALVVDGTFIKWVRGPFVRPFQGLEPGFYRVALVHLH